MPRLAPVFAATTLFTGVVSVHLWQQLRAERERSGQLQQRVTQLKEETPATPSPPAAEMPTKEQLAAGLPIGQAAATATPAQAQSGTAAKAPTRNFTSFNMAELLKDPEFREAQREQLRLSLPQNYPDLARELGLTPREADALFDLLSKQQMRSMANSLNLTDGHMPDEATMREQQRMAQENQRTQDAELTSLLGSAKLQQFREYQTSMGARQQVTQLRTTLAASGGMLGDEPASSLVALLSAEQKRRTQDFSQRRMPADLRGQQDFEEETLEWTADSNRRVLDSAASFLNAQQLETFGSMLNRNVSMSRALQRAQRAQQEAQAGAAGAAPAAGGFVIVESTAPN